MSISIVLADDHTLFRDGLRALLERQADMTIVGEVDDGAAAVRAAKTQRPELLVMDISMPGLNGIEATRQIAADYPEVKVLCLSMHHDRRYVLAALEAGASGYLLKESALDELTRAIHEIAGGRTYLSPAIASVVVDAFKSEGQSAAFAPFDVLTQREREVLQLLAEGHSTKRVAARLNVSAKTVSTHREHIMKKLDLHSIAELTKYAIREGLTSVDR